MTWSILDIIRSLGTCPWGTLARSAFGLPRRRAVPADLQDLVAPWAQDAHEALARIPAEQPLGGSTWMPLHGSVPWTTSPTAFRAGDPLTGWMRCRLTDAFHAARVALLNQDDEAARQAVGMIEAFRVQNPVGEGPAWTSAMEAALRGMRLVHAGALLVEACTSRQAVPRATCRSPLPVEAGTSHQAVPRATCRSPLRVEAGTSRQAVPGLPFRSPPRVEAEKGGGGAALDLGPIASALADHEAFLRSCTDWRLHFTGNHHVVALAGTFLLAAHLPGTPGRRRDARRAWSLFWREFQRQVGWDGLQFESSAGYHLLVAETAAHVALAGARLGFERAGSATARLAACAAATAALMRPDGTLAPIGDCDDGAFLDLSPGRTAPVPLDARPVAALLAIVTGDRECAARACGDRRALEAVAWVAGTAGLCRLAALQGDAVQRPACMPAGGMAVLAAGSGAIAHVTVSATPRGRSGTGGHGHDDAGSYELWLAGPLVVDRGTGAYARDPALRQRLRSVLSHAVVQVDGRDQNPPGPSIWRRIARAKPLMTDFSSAEGGAVAIGHHGYCVSPGSVTVLRRVSLSREGVLDVIDDIEGAGEHDVVLRLPWAPGITLATGDPTSLRLDLVRGAARVATCEIEGMRLGEELPATLRHIPAEHAARQLEVVPATTTEARWRCSLPLTIRHRIAPVGGVPV